MEIYSAIEKREEDYWRQQKAAAAQQHYKARIKLCGLSRELDIATANELAVDYIGFVFAPRSKRYVSHEQAATLKKLLAPSMQAVGVFVDAEPEEIVSLWRHGIIDVVQLHGHEDEDYIGHLRAQLASVACERFPDILATSMPPCPPIFKAFSVKSSADITAAEASSADYVLLDEGAGGTGKCCDWQLCATCKRPYFLAGGLNPDNVTAALSQLHPFAVDVSSGIESDGIKDLDKMRAFVTGVRSAS